MNSTGESTSTPLDFRADPPANKNIHLIYVAAATDRGLTTGRAIRLSLLFVEYAENLRWFLAWILKTMRRFRIEVGRVAC